MKKSRNTRLYKMIKKYKFKHDVKIRWKKNLLVNLMKKKIKQIKLLLANIDKTIYYDAKEYIFFHLSRKKKYLTNGPFARQLRRVRRYHKLRTPRDEWSHRESLSFSTPLPFYQALLLARPYTHSRQSMSARCGRLRRQSLFIDRCVHSRSVQKWPLRDRGAHIL